MPDVVPYGLRPDWFIVTDEIARELAYVPGLRRDEKHDVWMVHRSHLPLLGEDPALIQPESTVSGSRNGSSPTFSDGSTLRSYQVAGVEYIRSRRGTLLADGMRVGKTPQCVAAHDPDDGPLVVIGPLPVRSVWLDWIGRRFGDVPIKVLRGRTYDPDEVDRYEFIFGHYDILPAWASMGLRRRIGTLVFDEGHYLSNHKSKRTQGAFVVSAFAERVIMATGTPLWNRTAGLWPLLTIVNQGGAWGSFREFTERYASGEPGPWGWTTGSPSRADEFRERMREVMIRRRWEDITDHLPPLTRTIESAPISRKEEIEIDKLAAQIREDMAAGRDLSDDTVAGNLARIRRVVANKKTPVAAELAARVLVEKHPVVVWVWHRDVAQKIAKFVVKRGHDAFIMTGDYTEREREQALDEWRGHPDAALIVSMAVAPAGLDFSHAAHCIVAELDWTPATVAQAVMRTYSAERPNFEIYVVAEHDVEYRLINAIVDKSTVGTTLGVPAADAVGDISTHLNSTPATEIDLGSLAKRISGRIDREQSNTPDRPHHSGAAGYAGDARGDADVAADRADHVGGDDRHDRDGAGHGAFADRIALPGATGSVGSQALGDQGRAGHSRSAGRQSSGQRHQSVQDAMRPLDLDPEYVSVEVDRVLVETDRAILCLIEGEKFWIPTSEIRDDSVVKREGDFGDLIIPEWLADDRGID